MPDWLISRGSRFYDITGILVLTLCIESLFFGMAKVKELIPCLLYMIASLLFLISGMLIMNIYQTLRILEYRIHEDQKGQSDEESAKLEKARSLGIHRGITRRTFISLFLITASLCLLAYANMESSSIIH
jgi:hypothetical protein